MEDVMNLDKLDAYIKGYEAGSRNERAKILRLAKEASTEDSIGQLVYLNDLNDYIRYDDEEN